MSSISSLHLSARLTYSDDGFRTIREAARTHLGAIGSSSEPSETSSAPPTARRDNDPGERARFEIVVDGGRSR